MSAAAFPALDWTARTILVAETGLLACAGIGDLARRLIPNALCLAVAALGLGLRLLGGPQAAAQSALLAALLFLALLLVHRQGWMGGGDVKLLVAVSLGLPPGAVLDLLTMTVLAGGVLAAVHLALRPLPMPAPAPAGSSLPRRLLAVERWRSKRHVPLPFGVAIACGGILVLLRNGV